MLAAGYRNVGGLGARAIYGVDTLDLVQFEEAWAIFQLILELDSDEGREEKKREREIRRAILLEKQGRLTQTWNPFAPDGGVFDPGG